MKGSVNDNLEFVILLPEKVANIANKHMPFYTKKGLLKKYGSL